MAELDQEAQAFMAAIISATDRDGPNQLAGLLVQDGRLSYGEARKVAKWARGEHFPDGKSALMLLDVAGFLTEEARRALGLPARPLSAAETAELADATAEGERAEQRLERPAPGSRRRRTG